MLLISYDKGAEEYDWQKPKIIISGDKIHYQSPTNIESISGEMKEANLTSPSREA